MTPAEASSLARSIRLVTGPNVDAYLASRCEKPTIAKRRYLQYYRREEGINLDDCHSCEGTGRAEVIEHGDQSHWETCQHCGGKGNFAVDFDELLSDKWLETWHGSNEEKD
jgi:hypothetical protein